MDNSIVDPIIGQGASGRVRAEHLMLSGRSLHASTPRPADVQGGVVIIEILRNTAVLTTSNPGTEPLASVKELLTYQRQAVEAGLQIGYGTVSEERVFWSVDTDDRLIISIGAIARVRDHLERQGHTVLVSRAPGYTRIEPNSTLWPEVSLGDQRLLWAAVHHPRGQIVIGDWSRQLDLMVGIVRLFPDAQVMIPLARRAEVEDLRQEFLVRLWPDRRIYIAGQQHEDVRLLIGTFQDVGEQAVEFERRLVIFPFAEDILDNDVRKWVRLLVDEWAYAFARPSLRLTEVEQLMLEDVAGPLIFRVRP